MKAVILNSGGFDSVTMVHLLNDMETGREFVNLFFDHDQNAVNRERECSRKCAAKFDMPWKQVRLPKFYWTQGNFYDTDAPLNPQGEVLEWRNLVFLSYAFSYAQAIGAEEIYVAMYRMFDDDGYDDSSMQFIDTMNCITGDIQICAPFSGMNKFGIVQLAKGYGISRADFSSCDHPLDEDFCGDCEKCRFFLKQGF